MLSSAAQHCATSTPLFAQSDVVGQAGRPKTITGWQTQSTPVLLGYGERAELEDEEWVCLANAMEGVCILRKVSSDWDVRKTKA